MPIGIYLRSKKHKEKLRLSNLGKKLSEKTKKKISDSKKGKKQTEEHIKKRVQKLIGKKHTEETKLKFRMLRLGKKRPKEIGKKISISRKKRLEFFGYLNSKETRKKISDSLKGKKKPPRTIEHCMNMSISQKGEKSHLWLGGFNKKEYPIEWVGNYRKIIRERDKYNCQICKQKQTNKTFSVHHIDYNKKNCNPKNLITLCRPCHTKTNWNRGYWIEYFKEMLV